MEKASEVEKTKGMMKMWFINSKDKSLRLTISALRKSMPKYFNFTIDLMILYKGIQVLIIYYDDPPPEKSQVADPA